MEGWLAKTTKLCLCLHVYSEMRVPEAGRVSYFLAVFIG